MQTLVTKETEGFYKLREDWVRLQEQDPDVTYYSTYEYVKTWWEAHKDDKHLNLLIVCVYQNDDIVGIGPFIIQHTKKRFFSWSLLKFLGRGDYLGVLLKRGQSNEMNILNDMFKCLEENSCWNKMHLTHINTDSALAHFFFQQGKYNSNFRYLIECPRLNLKKFSGFQEYKRLFVSKSAKKYSNKLKREHNYTFEVKSPAGSALINQVMTMHRQTQKHLVDADGRRDRYSLFEESRMREHVVNLCRNKENVVVFLLLDGKGKIIIYDMCFLCSNVLYSWNTSYNPLYIKYNAGRIMYYEIMNYLFDGKIADVFDFGTGRYPWKFEWTDDFASVYQLDMWNTKTKKARRLMKIFTLKSLVKQILDCIRFLVKPL